ncbi:Uncharacterised protein [Streptococcus gordonii]|nr:Uncharacterised protein [Streptococcus gordonii]
MNHIERTDGRVSYRIERIVIRLLRLTYVEMGNQAS